MTIPGQSPPLHSLLGNFVRNSSTDSGLRSLRQSLRRVFGRRSGSRGSVRPCFLVKLRQVKQKLFQLSIILIVRHLAFLFAMQEYGPLEGVPPDALLGTE